MNNGVLMNVTVHGAVDPWRMVEFSIVNHDFGFRHIADYCSVLTFLFRQHSVVYSHCEAECKSLFVVEAQLQKMEVWISLDCW